ncbi:MAG: NTP/NDP exchange transporter [Verrucomicrobia bacterium]|nr:NTP/NDP exchange transporter [Verrucomicrobiota bacterium]
MSTPSGFGKLRSLLWPIYGDEHRKFVPMFLIFFLICFNYSVLRSAKDALIVTAPFSGAEALPFLKVWAILPAALLFTFIFTRLSNWLSREKVFYALMSIFLGFFFIFTFFLYPNQAALHPHFLADKLQDLLPQGFSGLIAIFRNWTYTTFYIMSEMWSTMIMTVLFWGFANEVTSVRVGKRFYAILGIGANLATTFAGLISNRISTHTYNPAFPFGVDGWGQSVFMLNSLVILAGLLCMGIFRWLHLRGLGYNAIQEKKSEVEQKFKMGIRENFKFLAKSKYLLCIAVVVIMFNISLTLIEVVWKGQIKELYPNPNDFNAYFCNILTWTGIIATIGAFISSYIIRRFSWTVGALIPPAIFLITGVGFFSFLLFKDSALSSLALALGSTPLAIGVFFGSLQNVLARASKYTLFDATKELSFIPLSKESRMKGKAAIDGFGSRLGKSGASVIHQGLIMIFGSISLSAPFVGGILVLVIAGWIAATRLLGKEFHALTSTHETLDLTTEEAKEPEPELVTTR